MIKLSEESRLIINNWDAYQDVMEAGERLNTELSALRSALESRLRKEKWWKFKWIVLEGETTEIAFTDGRWEVEEGHLIWVGVINLTAEAIFGNAPPPFLNVWIYGKRPELKAELHQIIKASGKPILGELLKPQVSFFVQKNLPKCLPEEIDKLEDMIYYPMEEFCKYYAQFFDEFNKAAQKHLKG